MVQLPSDSTSMLAPRFSRGTGDSYPDLLDFGGSEMFDTNQLAFRFAGANQLIGFAWIATPSRFWVVWIRKTIRKAANVVPVLMMSYHVCE